MIETVGSWVQVATAVPTLSQYVLVELGVHTGKPSRHHQARRRTRSEPASRKRWYVTTTETAAEPGPTREIAMILAVHGAVIATHRQPFQIARQTPFSRPIPVARRYGPVRPPNATAAVSSVTLAGPRSHPSSHRLRPRGGTGQSGGLDWWP